jgi:hypothetical protein
LFALKCPTTADIPSGLTATFPTSESPRPTGLHQMIFTSRFIWEFSLER